MSIFILPTIFVVLALLVPLLLWREAPISALTAPLGFLALALTSFYWFSGPLQPGTLNLSLAGAFTAAFATYNVCRVHDIGDWLSPSALFESDKHRTLFRSYRQSEPVTDFEALKTTMRATPGFKGRLDN
jgi:hypothetical protein